MFRTVTVAIALLLAAGAAQAQPLDGRLKKIADTKTIAIAYRADATPFSFTDDNNKQAIGFSIDLCKRVVNSIVRRLESMGESEIPSSVVGELVMESLANLDQVAYVRFASVYRNFREAKDFGDFVGKIGNDAED